MVHYKYEITGPGAHAKFFALDPVLRHKWSNDAEGIKHALWNNCEDSVGKLLGEVIGFSIRSESRVVVSSESVPDKVIAAISQPIISDRSMRLNNSAPMLCIVGTDKGCYSLESHVDIDSDPSQFEIMEFYIPEYGSICSGLVLGSKQVYFSADTRQVSLDAWVLGCD